MLDTKGLLVFTGVLLALAVAGNQAIGNKFLGAARTSAPEGYKSGEVRVIDGDTWEIDGVVYRHNRIDAPEISTSRAKCPDELRAGQKAKRMLQTLFAHGGARTYSMGLTGFYGRTLALIVMPDKSEGGQLMVEAGLAKIYGDPINPWCGVKTQNHRRQTALV